MTSSLVNAHKVELMTFPTHRLKANMPGAPRESTCQGFTLTEAMVAAVTTFVIAGGAAVGMRSLNSAIRANADLSGLRSNAITGTRLLRTEVQRSQHLIVKGGTHSKQREYTDINSPDHPEYKTSIDTCQGLEPDSVFNPFFGLKMAELNTPVIYGLGLANSGMNYALIRCGPPLKADGYYETETAIRSTIFEGIGTICNTNGTRCNEPQSKQGHQLKIAQIAASLNTTLNTNNRSGLRSYLEPAIAIQTDESRKLLRIIDPTQDSDAIKYSYLENPSAKAGSQVDLDLTAYARAEKLAHTDSLSALPRGNNAETINRCEGSTCSFYGIPVNSDSVQLIVDGSGAMSECIAWGSTRASRSRVFFNADSYFETRLSCLATRMDSLQSELRNLLNSLPSTTSLSLQVFSSPGQLNHRNWKQGELVALTPSNRNSALAFINSLSNGPVTQWGDNDPWDALDRAFKNDAASNLYFLSSNQPTSDPNGGAWSSQDDQTTANRYAAINNSRKTQLAVNTVSVGLHSAWMEMISNNASGSYKLVN